MLYDFHTHTLLSDGELIPTELVRRAIVHGYTAIGLTDHVSQGTLAGVLDALIADCEMVEAYWEIRSIPGVELTHLPPAAIAGAASFARERGAQLVIVHGETPVEPAPPGTNLAALRCPEVDILAHPGLIDVELADLAARNNIFLEISARKGHCLTNGAVAITARQAGARLLVNSDAHSPSDILTEEFARRVAAGAGLSQDEIQAVLLDHPKDLLDRIEQRR